MRGGVKGPLGSPSEFAGSAQLQASGFLRPIDAPVYGAVFSPDGTSIQTTSMEGIAMGWDATTGRELFGVPGNPGVLTTATFSSDGRLFVLGQENSAVVWDAETRRELLRLLGHAHVVNGAGFSPDGARIVTASRDQTAKIWDAHSGRELLFLVGHAGPVTSAAFSPDGKRIVTVSEDKTAKIWEAARWTDEN